MKIFKSLQNVNSCFKVVAVLGIQLPDHDETAVE